MRLSSLGVGVLALACSCSAIDIRGSIVAQDTAVSFLPLASDSKVVLNGGKAGRAFIRADGGFTIRDVPEGSYVLSVLDREYSFPSLAVKISEASDETSPVEVRPYTIGRISSDPATVSPLQYPLVIKPIVKLEYYEVPKGFSLVSLIKQNKMILFMVFGVAFAVGMPKLLEMIDPEILKEVRANQAEMHRNLDSVQNLDVAGSLSKLLAGGEGTRPAGGSNPAQSGARRRK